MLNIAIVKFIFRGVLQDNLKKEFQVLHKQAIHKQAIISAA